MPPKSIAPRSLSRHLWRWIWLTMLLVWATLVITAWYTGRHEAQEINEGRLNSVARLWMQPDAAGTPRPSRYAPELYVIVWDGRQLVHDSHGWAPRLLKALSLPAGSVPTLADGQHHLSIDLDGGADEWLLQLNTQRLPDGRQRRVLTLLDADRAAGLGRDIAEHIIRPALVMLPLVALLLAWAIRRGLQPVVALSDDIDALDITRGQTLDDTQPYAELRSTVVAINDLTLRLQAQAERERRFAGDVAHELRTPLAALVWQSRLARQTADETERQGALARIEHEALRAGNILQQLLDLARAQRHDALRHTTVDLAALCQQVVAAHAELAHQRRQELSLDAPEHPVPIQSDATLLELMLRNLVDNALRHTPEGSQVWVLLHAEPDGSISLSVDDNGPGHTSDAPRDAHGLGIGLTLVERISQRLGLAWQHQPGTPQHPHGHTLRWRPR